MPKRLSNRHWKVGYDERHTSLHVFQGLPVAEEADVRLALHPDDPPVESLRGTARLVNQPQKYKKLLKLVPSPSNSVELCMGSIQEMTEGDIYESLDTLSKQQKIAYVHVRNYKRWRKPIFS